MAWRKARCDNICVLKSSKNECDTKINFCRMIKILFFIFIFLGWVTSEFQVRSQASYKNFLFVVYLTRQIDILKICIKFAGIIC